MKLRASLAVGVLAASTVAFGVAGLGTVETAADDTIDAYKKADTGDVVDTTPIGTVTADYDTARTNGMEAVAELEVGAATDLQFQRRDGEQLLAGESVDRVLDLAVVGISGGGENAVQTVDVTDPANPVPLDRVDCGGFHNDVAIWKNYIALGFDGSGSGCDGALQKFGPGGLPSGSAVWVFDATDPANLELAAVFSGANDADVEELTTGTHNLGIHPDGFLYFATAGFDAAEPDLGIVDLNDLDAGATMVNMKLISPAATDGCHDLGFNFETDTPQMVCPAIETTFIWDLSDPMNPVELSTIPNPAINIHHGGRYTPDGSTVVLGDELGGAAGGAVGGTGGKSGLPIGSLFTYDVSTVGAAAPVLTGYASASEGIDEQLPGSHGTVTSHFYNFVPTSDGSTKVVTGWYTSGMVVHDITDTMGANEVVQAPEIAHIEPENGWMWNAYAYRGHVFGNSYDGNTGLFVSTLDGYTDTADAELAPYCNDVGIVWGPWTDDWRSECISPNA